MLGGSGGWFGENPATTSGVTPAPVRSRNASISMSCAFERREFVEEWVECQNGGIDISGVAIIIRISRDHRPGCGLDGSAGGCSNPTLNVSSAES